MIFPIVPIMTLQRVANDLVNTRYKIQTEEEKKVHNFSKTFKETLDKSN